MSKVVLGKGLDALIPSSDNTENEKLQYKMVPLDQIAPNPMQPRKDFDASSLNELAESLRLNGVLQPLVVQRTGNNYTIVAGERRFRAARLANLSEVPVVIKEELDKTQQLALAIIENIHRKNLNPIETALAYKRLLDECNLTQADLAIRVGKSRTAVTNQLRLLSLPQTIIEKINENVITEGHARAILALESEQAMLEMVDQIINGTLSVRETESRTRTKKRGRRAQRKVSPAIAEMESKLRQLLATSVKIIPGGKKSKIEIEYYSEEDLTRLWELLSTIKSDHNG